jgi:hypothetical protein
MNVQLLDILLWWPCNARCEIMQFCVQNQLEQFVTQGETRENHISLTEDSQFCHMKEAFKCT